MNEEITLLSNIKSLRKARGITGEMLAEAIGKSTTYYRRFESGSAPPSYSLIRDISVALGVSISDLFESSNNKKSNLTQNLPSLLSFIGENSEWITKLSTLPEEEIEMLKDITEASLKAVEEQSSKKSSQA